MEHLEIRIEGMQCDGCVASVQRALTNRPGVGAARADLDSGMVAIDFDPARIDRPGLETAIQDAGFDIAAGWIRQARRDPVRSPASSARSRQ